MENEISIIFTQAQQEISQNGVLSFPTRRKLWLTFGPWEVRSEDDPNPRTLTEPLKKRAELALACAKKVSRIWSAYDSEDKRPQKLIKETRAYLDGKRTARQLAEAGKAMEDFMTIIDEEADSTAPSAGMAAWNALVTAIHDEPLLEERYADAEDSDLDSYDWDAAREASEAWAGAGRAEALIKQMEERAILRFEVTEHGVALNDRALDYLSRRLLEANLIPGLEWTDRDEDGFAVDLSVFGPHVVFQD
ncbi:MAG: hypothetical protein K2G28_07185, partial [Acetatifactor sp.]|nr:hypothetical protein [Acetatifactor sp.]